MKEFKLKPKNEHILSDAEIKVNNEVLLKYKKKHNMSDEEFKEFLKKEQKEETINEEEIKQFLFTEEEYKHLNVKVLNFLLGHGLYGYTDSLKMFISLVKTQIKTKRELTDDQIKDTVLGFLRKKYND